MQVLIVDDNPDDVAAFRRLVRGLGLHVEAASDGRSGLERALRERFDIIVLDYRLGDMLGTDVLARLHESGRRVPVIVHSGRVSARLRQRSRALGADDVLGKDDPQYADRMRAWIQSLIERIESAAGGRLA